MNVVKRLISDKWLLSCFAINFLLKVIWFFYVALTQGLYGDEVSYYSYSNDILEATGLWDILEVLFIHQHRMPGTTLIICISQMLSDSLALMRLFFMGLETSLFIVSVLMIIKVFGLSIGRIFSLCVAISPMFIAFSFNVWGDLIAGWLVLLSAVLTYWMLEGDLNRKKHSFIYALCIGGIWGISMYFRPSMITFGPFLYIYIIVIYFHNNIFCLPEIKKVFSLLIFISFGFSLVWGPWIGGASLLKNELTVQPAQNIKDEKWLKWKIWAYSPTDDDWAYRRGARYDNDLNIMTKEFDGNRELALKTMYERVISNSTLATLTAAISRNVINVVGNENQFLAGAMSVSGIEGQQIAWFPDVKREHTRGGHQVKFNYSPIPFPAKLILLFNSFWFYSISFMSIVWLCRSLILGSSFGGVPLLVLANVVCVLSMSFYHPGHGRYLFSMLPMIVVGASCLMFGIGQNIIYKYKDNVMMGILRGSVVGILMLSFMLVMIFKL